MDQSDPIRLVQLPRVSPDDPRVGADLVGIAELAAERGQAPDAMGLLIRRRRIAPVAAVHNGAGRHLFDREELIAAGVWPIGGPFDRTRECWMSDYAARRGLAKAHVESMLRGRLAARLGLAGMAPPEMLAEEGIARRIGNRWVVSIAAADELLDAIYDRSRWATARELMAEVPGYSDARQLAPALKRGGVPSRVIIPPGGRRTLLFDRSAATRWMGGRFEARIGYALTFPAPRRLRTRVGSIPLRAPTTRTTIAAGDAAWLLDLSPSRVAAQAEDDDPFAPAVTDEVAIAWVEQRLVDEKDLAGLLLLARTVDGAFSPRADERRREAMLRLVEKAGWAG